MPILVERKLFRIGEGGIAVVLPKAWTNYYHLAPGDKVQIVVNDHLTIRINTKPEEKLI